MGLGGILDHLDPIFFGHRADPIHISRLTVEMDSNNRLGARRDRRLNEIGIDVIGTLIWLHWHRGRPRIAHRQPRCDKRMGRHDDFISSANTVTAENQMERVQTIPHSNAIRSEERRVGKEYSYR